VEGFGALRPQAPPPRHEIRIGANGAMEVEKWLAGGGAAAPPPAAPTGTPESAPDGPQG